MNWIQYLTKAVDYIENHLTEEINIDEVSSQSYMSSSHFQLIFHLVMGMTIGEYIRNRRLSLAAQDLLQPNSRIIDTAMRYQYDTQESFSKAFTRFHSVPPSKIQRGQVKLFYPLTININIQGGFYMPYKFTEEFHLLDWSEIDGQLTDAEKYKRLISWAGHARGQNPGVFDALTGWILDDSQWSDEKLACSKVPDVHFISCSSFNPNELMKELTLILPEYGTEITALCHFEHHNGGEVNVNQINMMGYFCKADTLVPEGYDYYDVPTEHAAYAVYYSPDFDGNVFDAAYEFTRDQILGDSVIIPYPLPPSVKDYA